MKQAMSSGLVVIVLTSMVLAFSGCTGAQHKDGSTYEKSKSDYEKKKEGSNSGSSYGY